MWGMPIYEYICADCKTPFEKLVLNKQQEISCPKCASKKATIQLSLFATSHGSTNGASAKSSTSFSGGGGGCCGGSCGFNQAPGLFFTLKRTATRAGLSAI